MEVKSDEGTVVVADRNRYSDECCNNRGWGSGWGAVGGALVGGGFGSRWWFWCCCSFCMGQNQ